VKKSYLRVASPREQKITQPSLFLCPFLFPFACLPLSAAEGEKKRSSGGGLHGSYDPGVILPPDAYDSVNRKKGVTLSRPPIKGLLLEGISAPGQAKQCRNFHRSHKESQREKESILIPPRKRHRERKRERERESTRNPEIRARRLCDFSILSRRVRASACEKTSSRSQSARAIRFSGSPRFRRETVKIRDRRFHSPPPPIPPSSPVLLLSHRAPMIPKPALLTKLNSCSASPSAFPRNPFPEKYVSSSRRSPRRRETHMCTRRGGGGEACAYAPVKERSVSSSSPPPPPPPPKKRKKKRKARARSRAHCQRWKSVLPANLDGREKNEETARAGRR